jgi:serine protease Do
MLKQIVSALLSCAVAASAATVQLRDKASVTGTILTEKHDTIIVDLGYTVLSIPRKEVVRILNEDVAPEKTVVKTTKTSTKAPVVTEKGFKTIFTTSATPLKERTVRELVNQLGESVVQVRTPGGLGSGFFINEDGYLITNFHVTEGETQISVEVYNSKNGELERKIYKQVRIVALNKFADLALLKIEDKDAGKFVPVALGDSEQLSVGERVFAIGSPLGLERTVTEGIISTKTRQFQGDLYLQTTAQINPGNSGGPLFNMRGEVVGVTNMKITFGEGLGFAIPVENVKYFLIHRDSFAYDNDNPSNAYRYLEPPSRARKSQID